MYFVHKKPIKQLSVCFGLLFVGKGLQVWRLRSLFFIAIIPHQFFFNRGRCRNRQLTV